MDILKYSALKAVNGVNSCINGGANTAANTAGFNAGIVAGSQGDAVDWNANSATYICSQRTNQWFGHKDNMPWCSQYWGGLIPRLPGSASTSDAGINPTTGSAYCGYKVCATNFYGAASNTWTVPAGTSFARFQIWGAGGKGGSGCCCGGSIWGTSGAYASVIIPVVPGCQYTLCAGCAIATTSIWGGGSLTGRGCQSYVTGYGLSNFCAEGATAVNHYNLLAIDQDNYSQCSYRWAAPWCSVSSGACMCNSCYDFCFSSSCSSCGIIAFSRSKAVNFYGTYTGGTAYNTGVNINFSYGQQVVGLPGLNGGMCFDTNFYGWTCVPPVYGYESTTTSCLCMQGNSIGGLCCNHVGYNYRRAPGAGATATILFGGCTAMCDPSGNLSCGGDIGRSGMVCVTWF